MDSSVEKVKERQEGTRTVCRLCLLHTLPREEGFLLYINSFSTRGERGGVGAVGKERALSAPINRQAFSDSQSMDNNNKRSNYPGFNRPRSIHM
jgi:hypothetical protein